MEGLNLKVKGEDEAVIRLKELYRQYGYIPYKMSKFEEYDLYVENKNFLISDDIITFSDFNGKLMALKPDVTLSIIKKVRMSDETEKMFYHENVYRAMKNTREVREILQMGLECIGDIGIYETAEVLNLSAKSLEALTKSYVIDISHMGFINGLLKESGLDFAQQRTIMNLIKEKNSHEIAAVCRDAGTGDMIAQRICRTASIWGSFENVLPELKKISINQETENAIQELEALHDILRISGSVDNMKIDFSVIHDISYYNAIVFQGFVDGIPVHVLSGGRYDKLMEKFNQKSGAIGFAVYLGILWQYTTSPKCADTDVLLYYDDDTDLKILSQAVKNFTDEGKSISVCKRGRGKDERRAVIYEIRDGRLLKI